MRILILCLLVTGCAHRQYNDNLHFEDIRCDIGHTDTSMEEECAKQGVRAKGAIKTWTGGETLHSADINSNFNHIHSLMVGGHGARLVDADVSLSASIAQSKIANLTHYVPRGWFAMKFSDAGCGTASTSCTITGIGSMTMTGGGTGAYNVSLGYTASDNTYGVSLSLRGDAVVRVCDVVNVTTTGFQIICKNTVPALSDVGFTAVVYDDN